MNATIAGSNQIAPVFLIFTFPVHPSCLAGAVGWDIQCSHALRLRQGGFAPTLQIILETKKGHHFRGSLFVYRVSK
jgi:hypothetical protein